MLTCFGFGDGGGGTTREMLEEEKRLEAGAGNFTGDCPAVRITGVKEFFHILENNLEGKKVPRWCGELYLEFHRGTYTSMARIKKNNPGVRVPAHGRGTALRYGGVGGPGIFLPAAGA